MISFPNTWYGSFCPLASTSHRVGLTKHPTADLREAGCPDAVDVAMLFDHLEGTELAVLQAFWLLPFPLNSRKSPCAPAPSLQPYLYAA